MKQTQEPYWPIYLHEHDRYSKSCYVVQLRTNEDVTCEFSQCDFDNLSCEKKCIQISLLQIFKKQLNYRFKQFG